MLPEQANKALSQELQVQGQAAQQQLAEFLLEQAMLPELPEQEQAV